MGDQVYKGQWIVFEWTISLKRSHELGHWEGVQGLLKFEKRNNIDRRRQRKTTVWTSTAI